MRSSLFRETALHVVLAGTLIFAAVGACRMESDAPHEEVTRSTASALVGPSVTVQNYDGTAEGTLLGLYDGYSYNYLGVPYAAPPVGQLRLAPPAKVTAWAGNRAATAQSYVCAQGSLNTHASTIGSEDCLYLNVWTTPSASPATPNLPVLVFHHGGGGIFGGTSAAGDGQGVGVYDANQLARAQNAIVVTIQSRLGALGYLADPALSANATSRTSTTGGGTSGNYGLLDTIQALKWIKRNIAQFGGDPTHVTYFGQSSGATNACMLLASPLAIDPADNQPYFSSVIMESGFCEEPAMSTVSGTAAGMLPDRLTVTRYSQAASAMTALGCNVSHGMTGTPTLTFAEVGATGDTITRSAGSWITDGFAVGDAITVTGSASNNVIGTIASLTATVITLGTTDLAPEGPVSGVTVVGSNPTTEVACLRSAPLQKFVDVAGTLTDLFPSIVAGAISPEIAWGLAVGPGIDGYVVPKQPRLILSDSTANHPKVPVIVGSNKDEGSSFMFLMKDGYMFGDTTHTGLVPSTCAAYTARVTTNLGATLGAAALAMYPCNPSDPLSPMLQYSKAVGQLQYECPARRTLRALAQGQTQPIRRYWFTHAGDNNGLFQNFNGMEPWIGAFHSAEIPYLFNTHNTMFYVPSTREQNLGTALQKYWRAFAASGSGSPNYTGGTNWPAYVVSDDNALKLEVTGKSGPSDPGIQTVPGIDTTECNFWDTNFTLDRWY